jgi:hypothetical protein
MGMIYYENGIINFPLYSQAVQEMLEHPSNRYHLTVNPKDGFDERLYYEAMNFLLVLINQYLFGKRYMNRDNFIKGYVVREQKPGDESPHFHFILHDPNGLIGRQKYSLYHCVSRAISKVQGLRHWSTKSEKAYTPSQLIGDKCWSLQDYHVPTEGIRLEKYLTKSILDQSMSVQAKLGLFGVLGKDAIWWGMEQGTKRHSASTMHQVNRDFKRFGKPGPVTEAGTMHPTAASF